MLQGSVPIHFELMARRFHISMISFRGSLWGSLRIALAILAFSTAQSVAQDEEVLQEMEDWAAARLPDTITAIASGIIESESLTAGRLELVVGMLSAAIQIGPDSLPALRKQLQLATAMRDDVQGAEELEQQSIDAVVRLDPKDTVSRLRQILLRIEQRQTAEQRIEGYQSFLTPKAVDAIGETMASRLAFDLALLEKRTGNTNGYVKSLAKAIELDPSFPPSASAAAGFFRVASEDVGIELELLIAAVTADPANETLMRALGKLLLRHGAYTSASKILELAVILSNPRSILGRSVTEDSAIAFWGNEEPKKAIALLDQNQRDRASALLMAKRMRDPSMDRHEFLESVNAPSPELALLKAVILSDSSDPSIVEAFFPTLEGAFEFQRELLNEDIASAEEKGDTNSIDEFRNSLASLAADEAWSRLWCGLDVKKVPDLIDEALSSQMIDSGQAQVLNGWLAFREGRLEEARTIFTPIAENSPYAAAGLAMVDLAAGEMQSAARAFLKVYLDVPGTAMGLWCRGQLQRLLRKKITQPEEALELETLAERIPTAVSRIVRSPQSTLALSISAVEKPIHYYDTFKVRVVIRNTTSIPLAIGVDCPINPTLAIVPEVTAASTEVPPLEPLIFSLERALQIPANGSVEYEYNISATPLGLILDEMALQGATIRFRCVVNYRIAQKNVTLGFLGEKVTSLPIRMDGAYLSGNPSDNLVLRIEDIEDLDSVKDLAQIALLGRMLDLDIEVVTRQRQLIANKLTEAYQKIGPIAKAWVLAQLPSESEVFTRLVDSAISTNNAGVYAILLSEWSPNPGDAGIVSGLKSDDPLIRQMAEAAQKSAKILELLQQRQFLLDEEGESDQDPG